MQCIYTYIPETNCVPRQYSVAAILLLLFMVLISLVSVLNLLHFYISTFRSLLLLLLLCIFGHKIDKVTWELRTLRNENLYDVSLNKRYSGDKINKNGMGRACSTYVEQESCIQGFGG